MKKHITNPIVKSFAGVQGAVFQKSPLVAEGSMLLHPIRKTFLWLLLLLIIVPLHADKELDISHKIGKKKISVVPDTMLRGYDPVTVFFPGEVGPVEGGPLDQPGKHLNFSPDHPGEYKWLDGKTLQFLPTTPWPALERFSISTNGKKFKVSTLMAPPRQITPNDGAKNLEPVKEINLAFSNPIDTRKLAMMITLEVRTLPGVGKQSGYWLTARDFIIKEMERESIHQPVRYRITLHKPLPYGKHIILHLRLSLDSRIPGSLTRYTFSTRPLFRLLEVGTSRTRYPVATKGSIYSMEQAMDCGTGQARLVLRFSDSLAPVTVNQVKQMVHFSPAVRNLTHHVSGSSIRLKFDADRDKPYRLKLRYAPILTQSRRKLATFGPTALYFFFRQSAPYLKWLASRGIMERFGPQVFPMEGRNLEQVDLRVYKINPFNRNFWPFPSSAVRIDESKRPMGPGEEPAYTVNLREQLKQLGSPLVSKVVPLPLKTGTGLRFGIDLKEHFAKISGADRPGTYLVGYRTIGTTTWRYYIRVQVTDLSLSTVEEDSKVAFVVTSLKTGSPIPGATVKVEGVQDGKWETFLSGVTEANGIFYYVHKSDFDDRVTRISVSKGTDQLVLDPANAPPHYMNNHWYRSYRRWLNWLCTRPNPVKSSTTAKGHILTERPVYRPEEVVHIKGYAASRKQGKITPLSSGVSMTVRINGPGGKLWSYRTQTTEHGSVHVKFDEKDLPTGIYTASLMREDKWGKIAEVSFKKEAYRIPRFEVNLSAPKKVALDEPFTVAMTAGYYAGGPVIGRNVHWRVSQRPYYFRLPDYEGFLFSSDRRFSSRSTASGMGGSSKSDITNDKGSAALVIDPTKEQDSRSRRYIIEATVRGADEQTVSTTHSVLALTPFVLGLKMDRFLQTGKPITPRVIVVGHDGKPLAGKKFRLKLLQRQWHSHLQESDFTTGSAKYVTDVVDKLILEKDYTSGTGIKSLTIPISEAGVYIVELSSRDKQGRLQKVQADLYAAGDTPVAWKKPKANVFDTTPDRSSYNPGDTAVVILKSPFQQARALAVVEGPAFNTYHWVQVKRGQAIFKLPIKGDMHPRVAVHFLLKRGRLAKRGKQAGRLQMGRQDRAKPITMASTAWLKVNPKDNQLNIELNHQEEYLPGTKMNMSIKLKDPDGNPLNGEVTLWLVDRAVLALGKEKRLDPLPSFIDPVRSILTLRGTRNRVVGNLSQEEVAGGDGEEESMGGSIFDQVTVRKNFKTVPYFNPRIMVKNGVAEIVIKLPENLTDFAIRAVAVTQSGRYAAKKSMVSIRLPLIVQPALPRFVRPGDSFKAGGIGRVVQGDGGPGSAELVVKGLTLDASANKKLPINWVKGKPEKVFFPLSVPMDATVKKDVGAKNSVLIKLAVKRDTDQAMDAFQLEIPVQPDKTRRRLQKFVTLKKGKQFTFPKPIETPRPGTMKQSLLVTPEPALIKMLAALNYLIEYPHGCTEQRLSKLLPQLALKDVLEHLGRPLHVKTMNKAMAEMFTFLESCQAPNGLYSFWPGSRAYVHLTAYVVDFLVLAKKTGYTFKAKLLDRGIKALKESLRSDYSHFIDGYSYMERAAALHTLANANYFDSSYAHDLMARAINMDLYSEANILYSFLVQRKPYQKAVDRLSKDLWNSLIFKLIDGNEAYEGLQFRSSSWGGLILSNEVKTMASVTRALHKSSPTNKRVRLLTDELVNLGTGDGWGSTNANAAALLALGQVLGRVEPSGDGYLLDVSFGTDKQQLDTKGKVITRLDSNLITPGKIKMTKANDIHTPLAWLITEYIPEGSGDKLKSRSNGFVVTRWFSAYEKENQPPMKYNATAGKTIRLGMGTIVEEHIQVVNSEKRFYVAIKAPFAAGFEPMNPNLATAPKEATPEGNFTRQPDYAIYADDSVTFYYDMLPKGTYDFYFRLRSSVEGSFSHPPVQAELMYQMDVNGNSDGTRIVVRARKD